MDAYCIIFKQGTKLTKINDLEVLYVDSDDLAEYMREDGVDTIDELTDNNWMFFKSESEADEYLEAYKRSYKLLFLNNYCVDRNLPCLFFARHNLVQIIAGLKTSTSRKKLYGKMGRIKKSEFFNASDRTYFVTCRARDFVYGKPGEPMQLAFSFMGEM